MSREPSPRRSRVHGWEEAPLDVEHPFMESNHNVAPLHLRGRALAVALIVAGVALGLLIAFG